MNCLYYTIISSCLEAKWSSLERRRIRSKQYPRRPRRGFEAKSFKTTKADTTPGHVLRRGRWSPLDRQLERLAMELGRPPRRIGQADLAIQVSDYSGEFLARPDGLGTFNARTPRAAPNAARIEAQVGAAGEIPPGDWTGAAQHGRSSHFALQGVHR